VFQQPLSPLFLDYLGGHNGVERFLGSARWDLEALSEASERALTRERPREAVAAALVRQQEARGAPRAAARAAELGEAGTVAIVTGQQAGLFGGPLYVLYKALGARKAARLLQARRGRAVVPVFWVASDDHDFAEVRSATVLDESGQIRTLRYSPSREPVAQPASHIVLDATAAALVQELRQCLPAGLHRDEVLARLGECYRPGRRWPGLSLAFSRLSCPTSWCSIPPIRP